MWYLLLCQAFVERLFFGEDYRAESTDTFSNAVHTFPFAFLD